MNYNIFFSPTGGTEKVVKQAGIFLENAKDIDLSLNSEKHKLNENDFCIIGIPSFGGRIPKAAADRLRNIQGNKTPAVIIVTYGSRAYEDTLIELKDLSNKQGFICIAAAAIITEHSIVREIAEGRPNEDDLNKIGGFSAIIKKRLTLPLKEISVPGDRPYKELHTIPIPPETNEACTKCGLCAKYCPVSVIPKESPNQTDSGKCISCMRCVRICPKKARKCNEEKLKALREKLKKICNPNQNNEFI